MPRCVERKFLCSIATIGRLTILHSVSHPDEMPKKFFFLFSHQPLLSLNPTPPRHVFVIFAHFSSHPDKMQYIFYILISNRPLLGSNPVIVCHLKRVSLSKWKKKTTAPGVPRRSPIQVLTGRDQA